MARAVVAGVCLRARGPRGPCAPRAAFAAPRSIRPSCFDGRLWQHRRTIDAGATRSLSRSVLSLTTPTSVERANRLDLRGGRPRRRPGTTRRRCLSRKSFYHVAEPAGIPLPAPVVNRPAPEGPGGAWRHSSRWAESAALAGRPVKDDRWTSADRGPFRTRIPRLSDRGRPVQTVLVLAGHAAGAAVCGRSPKDGRRLAELVFDDTARRWTSRSTRRASGSAFAGVPDPTPRSHRRRGDVPGSAGGGAAVRVRRAGAILLGGRLLFDFSFALAS